MALIYQLEFFKSDQESHFKALEELVQNFKESNDRVRKGCFARINELARENRDLRERLDILERNICLGTCFSGDSSVMKAVPSGPVFSLESRF